MRASRNVVTAGLVGFLIGSLTVGTAVGAAVYDAENANRVDGKHAVGAGAAVAARAGRLVAADASGRLPNNIIAKAPDANRLDGLDSGAFARKTHAHSLSEHEGEACVVDSRSGTLGISTNPSNGVLAFQCVKTAPVETTISNIQTGTVSAGSYVRLSDVTVSGLTANQDRGWVQTGSGANAGVMVDPRDTQTLPPIGTLVDYEGIVAEVSGVTTITDALVTLHPSTPPPPVATLRTLSQLASNAEPYESTLVQVQNVTVTASSGNEFTVTDGSSTLVIDDLAYNWPTPVVGTTYDSIAGIVWQAADGVFKLEPRSAADMNET